MCGDSRIPFDRLSNWTRCSRNFSVICWCLSPKWTINVPLRQLALAGEISSPWAKLLIIFSHRFRLCWRILSTPRLLTNSKLADTKRIYRGCSAPKPECISGITKIVDIKLKGIFMREPTHILRLAEFSYGRINP